MFTYQVIYTLTATPTVHNAIIDGTPIVMALQRHISTGVDEYSVNAKLAPGPHTYSFQFSDGTTNWQLPLGTTPFTGPQVTPFDLKTIRVTPATSVQLGHPITFSAVYVSPTGGMAYDRPGSDRRRALRPHRRQRAPTRRRASPTRYTTSALSPGDHYFDLQFDDGTGLRTFEEYSTPAVTPISLTHSTVSPTSGPTSAPFTFTTQYLGTNPATQVDVEVDNVPFPMDYVSGTPDTGALYSTSLTLPVGTHNFAYSATDGTTPGAIR